MAKKEVKNEIKESIGVVIGGSLNVREERSTESKILRVLEDGAKVKIEVIGKEWCKLVGGGYIKKEFINLS